MSTVKLVHIDPIGGNVYAVREVKLGHPDQGLPTEPGTPDQGLPVIPGVPDNTLPTTPPPTVPPGVTLVIVRTADGKWHWATSATMPTPLPEPTPPTAQPKS